MSADPMQVYQAWPEATVMAELMVFKERMYGGAGSDELRAGLFALDFLTRASSLSETSVMLVDAAVCEAEMRIQLMDARSADERTTADNRQELLKQLRLLEVNMGRVTALMEQARGRFETVDDLHEYLEKYHRGVLTRNSNDGGES